MSKSPRAPSTTQNDEPKPLPGQPEVSNPWEMGWRIFARLVDSGKAVLAVVVGVVGLLIWKLSSADLKSLLQQLIHEGWFIGGGWVIAGSVWFFHSVAARHTAEAHASEIRRLKRDLGKKQRELDLD